MRSEFIAGIGNAYADEILWVAMIHPYRKRTQLTSEEIGRLYHAMQSTLHEATDRVRAAARASHSSTRTSAPPSSVARASRAD